MTLAREIMDVVPVDSIKVTIEKLRRVRNEIAEIRAQQSRLEALERMAQQCKDAILEHMDQIDCRASYSNEWEGRMIRFLLEITAPASKDEPPNGN